MIDGVTGPERRLAVAILARAVRDAEAGDALTRQWLERSPLAWALLEGLGLHRDRAQRWLEALDPAAQDALPGIWA